MEAEENHSNGMTPSSSFPQKLKGDNSHHDLDDLHIHDNGDNQQALDSKHAGDNKAGQSTPSSSFKPEQNGVNFDHASDDSDDFSMHENGDTPEGLAKEDAGANEVVILVVSDEERHKFGIVDALTANDSASWNEEVTLSGTRTLSRTSPARVVVDTTPLQCMSGRSPTAIARRWISHNSLNRVIVNKYVVVVCVLTCSILNESCNSSIFGYDNCWVDVLRILFKTHKGGVLTVVNAYNDTIDDRMKKSLRRFVRDHKLEKKNIIFSSTSTGGDDVARILEKSVGMKPITRASRSFSIEAFGDQLRRSTSRIFRSPKGGVESTNINSTGSLIITPQFMEEVFSKKNKFTAWDAERVILFGRAGSGKSTLAQMLTTGKLKPDSAIFSYGSGFRGHTKAIEEGEGRGWHVVDTPGFGEPNNAESTISTEDAQRKIKTFVEFVAGVYAHFIFVLKKDRIDQLETNLWKFFKDLFGESLRYHFTIVISNADKDWIEGNRDYLQRNFEGCRSFLCAEFPSTWTRISPDVEISQEEKEELRVEEEECQRESLEELEEELAKLERCDRACDYGKYSRMNKVLERDRSNSDMRIERALRTRMIVQGSEIMFQLDEAASMLMNLFNFNDRLKVAELKLT